MNVVVGIFARGGSKGVKDKNLLKFAGESLMARTIKQAQQIVTSEMVFVSTDSPLIAKEALSSGAKVPFYRPAELATDLSPEVHSWKHLLENISPIADQDIDTMLVLPVTSPMRRVQDIENALNLFESKDCDMVVSINHARKNPYFNMLEQGSNSFLELSKSPEKIVTRRQETPSVWEMNNAIYVAKIDYVKKLSNLLEGRILGYEMPTEYSIDIDTTLDVEFLRFLEERDKNVI
jgi:CMP-N-acetylneuraminic acid synthetase